MARKKSTALVARRRAPRRRKVVTKWRTRRAPAARRSVRRPALISGMPKKALAAAAAGFVMGQPSVRLLIENKLPSIGNHTLTAGLAAHFANKFVIKNSYVGAMADAMITVGAFEFGAQGLGLSDELAERQGFVRGVDNDDDAFDVSGTIGEEDADSFDDQFED